MNNQNKLGASVGKVNGSPTPQEKFFQQFIQLPPALQGGPWQIIGLEQSGISPRDYFAAHALATGATSWDGGMPDTARGIAEWCYRVADAMIEARKSANPVRENPDDKGSLGSQFHEDYMKPVKP